MPSATKTERAGTRATGQMAAPETIPHDYRLPRRTNRGFVALLILTLATVLPFLVFMIVALTEG